MNASEFREEVAGNAGNNACYMERGEKKYEVRMAGADLERTVSRYIPLHEYNPGRDTTIVRSVYFDNEQRDLFRDNLAGHDVQVRLRSYEYPGEASTECWMETKIKNGKVTKHRFKLSKELAAAFLKNEDVEDEVVAANAEYANAQTIRVSYALTRSLMAELELKPVLLVNYRRTAFQNSAERLSLDWDIGYYTAGPDGEAQEQLASENFILLEIKYPVGAFPVWMRNLKRRLTMVSRRDYSKFDRGMARLGDQ